MDFENRKILVKKVELIKIKLLKIFYILYFLL